MGVATIPIERLWPAEGVVTDEAVERAIASLRQGEPIKPIAIFEVNGRVLVRDGNNRVRAWIEYYGHVDKTPDIPCVLNDHPPRPEWEGPAIAEFCGRGPSAFLALRKVLKADYLQAQATFLREMRAPIGS